MSISELLSRAYRLVIPRLCACCAEPLPENRRGDVCEACAAGLSRVRLCGELRLSYRKSAKLAGSIDGVVASYRYAGAARTALLRYKYVVSPRVGVASALLVRSMADDLADFAFSRETDVVTCVPATDKNSRHAELLALSVAGLAGIPCDAGLLLKALRTPRQHTLPERERRTNLRGAFAASPAVKGLRVLVVDDVSTTGATLNECARALKAAGASRVYGLVFAST